MILLLFLHSSGPVANIASNFSEASESIACTAELAKNQSIAFFRMIRQPMDNIMKDLRVVLFLNLCLLSFIF